MNGQLEDVCNDNENGIPSMVIAEHPRIYEELKNEDDYLMNDATQSASGQGNKSKKTSSLVPSSLNNMDKYHRNKGSMQAKKVSN